MEDLTLRATAGAALPASPSDFAGPYDAGFSLDGGVGLEVTPRLTVRLRTSYQRFGAEEASLDADPFAPGVSLVFDTDRPGGADLSFFSFGLDLQHVFTRESTIAPYVVAGLSVYDIGREAFYVLQGRLPTGDLVSVLVPERSEEAFGLSFGLGLRFPVSYTAAFVIEPRYAIVFSDPERLHHLPIRAGFVFGEF